MPFDFIICGSEQSIAQWPKCALSIDLITEVNPDLHYIRAGNLAMDVIRLENLYDFVKHDAEAAITPALTERRERYEFVSGADGKIGEANHLRNKPAPPRDVASVQRFVIQITGHSAPRILASRPSEVEHTWR